MLIKIYLAGIFRLYQVITMLENGLLLHLIIQMNLILVITMTPMIILNLPDLKIMDRNHLLFFHLLMAHGQIRNQYLFGNHVVIKVIVFLIMNSGLMVCGIKTFQKLNLSLSLLLNYQQAGIHGI